PASGSMSSPTYEASFSRLHKNLDRLWIFKKQTDETALADFFDDEDLSLLVHQQSSFVTGLDQVFTLLGRFWFRLRPLYIHPEFKKLIWETVAPKIEAHQLRYWEKVIQ
ncbi:hypothetical protein ACEF06_26295, partial [Brevibacillus agri]